MFSMLTVGMYLALQFSPQTLICIPNLCAAAQASKHSAWALFGSSDCWSVENWK